MAVSLMRINQMNNLIKKQNAGNGAGATGLALGLMGYAGLLWYYDVYSNKKYVKQHLV
jgi:hypothetical protein